MPLADHGGFDVVAEIPDTTALAIARTLQFGNPPTAITTARFTGTVTIVASVSGVSLTAPDRLVLDIDLTGSRVDVTTVSVFGPPMNVAMWMQRIDLGGTIRVNAPLRMTAAHALDVNFTTAANDPIITVSLDEASILSSPLITMLLADAILADPTGMLYQLARATILDEFRTALETRVRLSLNQMGAVVLAPAPTLPSSTSGAANLIASSAFVILVRSIKLCYATRTGSGGTTAAITTTNLVRSTSTGAAVDAMAICLSNAFVLRDIIRDGFTVPPPTGPLIPLSAFQTTHPLLLMGPLITTVPGGPIPGIASLTYNSIFGGIDGTNIRLLISMTANGTSGAFSIAASIDAAFSITAGAGSPPSISVALVGTPTVRTDLSIAWWVYLGTAIVPFVGIPLATILAAADAFAGSIANGPIATALAGVAGGLGGTFSFPLGGGLPPLSVRPPVSLGQPNAIVRMVTVTIPGAPPLPIVDPFADNDVILTLV